MPVRFIGVSLLLATAAWAQGDALRLSQGASGAGKVTVNVVLESSAGEQPAAIQWTLSYSATDFSAIQVTAGATAVAAGKSVSCAGSAAAYTCIVIGENLNLIANGVVAVVSLTVSPSTSDTSSVIQMKNVAGASAAATPIPMSGTGATVTFTPASGSAGEATQSIEFVYTVGGAVPASQVVQIAGSGASWTANWTAAWLNVEPTSGTEPSAVTVSVNPVGLAVSAYTDTIQITTASSGGQMAIDVTVTVNAPTVFVPVTPCRVADTRNANGAFGGPSIAGGSSRNFTIPDSACNIPTNATAYSLNVAVVPAKTLGYLTVWPAGQTQPLVATLNSLDGRIKSNAAIVPAGTNGAISVYATDTTDVILDINGYFVPVGATGALAFFPLTPCRIADTRNPAGALGGPALGAQSVREFPIRESDCNLASAAEAYSLNFTAVPNGTLGYLTAWPAGEPQPVVASLNAVTGTTTANAVIVPAGTGGEINVFATNTTNLVIDTNGYFGPPGSGGLSFYNIAPCRVLDTRDDGGSPFTGTREVTVSGKCGVPSTAKAYVFNATVVPSGTLGYLTLWPQGQTQPVVSTLNADDGAITSNMAIVPAAGGAVAAFATNPTHLILDIFGYFAP